MSDRVTRITVYTPNDRSGGLLRTAAHSFRDIYRTRYLIWRLFLRDFRAQFRQSILGYAWAVLTPMVGVAGFIFMKYAGILNPGPVNVPYPVYAFIGTSIWSFMITTVGALSGGLRAQSELIMRTNVPKIALVAASLASIFYGILINFAMIFLLMLVYGVTLTWWVLLFPFLALPIVVLASGIGLVISVIGIIAKDFTSLVTQGLGLLMYLTPVVFLSSNIKSHMLQSLIMANPLTYLVDVPRSVLLGQGTAYLREYLGASAMTVLILLLGLKAFDMIQDLVAERL